MNGVREVFGFCDDWEVSVMGVRPIRLIRQVISDFELASGQRVHRTKSKFLPCRTLRSAEKRSLRNAWPDANIVESDVVLGTRIGINITIQEFMSKPLSAFISRIQAYRSIRMSLAMRIFVTNTYLYPLFSYIGRIILIPLDALKFIENHVLRFLTPITFCKLEVLCHLRSLVRSQLQLRDLHVDNLAGLLACSSGLQGRGAFAERAYDSWRSMALVGNPNAFDVSVVRPMNHTAVAYCAFRSYTGRVINVLEREFDPTNGVRQTKRLHSHLYTLLLRSQWSNVEHGLRSRWSARHLDPETILYNLRRIPSVLPAAHRIFLIRLLLNGVFTCNRTRFLRDSQGSACPFCQQDNCDHIRHWPNCEFLHALAWPIYGPDAGDIVSSATLALQRQLDGSELQRSIAFWYGVSRLRAVMIRGMRHHSFHDAVTHLRSLLDDPWLTANPTQNTRSQRRASRVQAPAVIHEGAVYNSDGAARNNGSGARSSSYGVLLRVNNIVVARAARYLGDVSNNVAEYEGVLQALLHASQHPRPNLIFRVDSLLVARQLQGIWACRSAHLLDQYERAIDILNSLRGAPQISSVAVEHVYREFNSDADGLANLAIDGYLPHVHTDGVVLNDRWSP